MAYLPYGVPLSCFIPLRDFVQADLQKVISHPQALAQCNSYLKSNELVGEAAYDTAGSAKLISEGCQQVHFCIFDMLLINFFCWLAVLAILDSRQAERSWCYLQ